MLVKITKNIEVAELTALDIKSLDVTTLRTVVEELLQIRKDPPQVNTRKGNILTGAKTGKTSKYHYTFFHTASGKYAITHTKGVYDNEIQAAIASDDYLDFRGDTKKPRNRDEFPELRKYSPTPHIEDYVESLS